jgi:hypothetical protein
MTPLSCAAPVWGRARGIFYSILALYASPRPPQPLLQGGRLRVGGLASPPLGGISQPRLFCHAIRCTIRPG